MFLLQDGNGKVDTNQVLKAIFKFGIGGLFGMTNLEREWRVGRQLSLLTDPGEALPGFMGTGSGVVTKSGKFRGVLTPFNTAVRQFYKDRKYAVWQLIVLVSFEKNHRPNTQPLMSTYNKARHSILISHCCLQP